MFGFFSFCLVFRIVMSFGGLVFGVIHFGLVWVFLVFFGVGGFSFHLVFGFLGLVCNWCLVFWVWFGIWEFGFGFVLRGRVALVC